MKIQVPDDVWRDILKILGKALLMPTQEEAIAKLKEYVATEYDGSSDANHRLDDMLWEVRLAHPNNHPETKMRHPNDSE